MIQHIKPVGISLIAYGAFNMLVLLGVGLLMGGFSGLMAFIGISSGDDEALVIGGIYGVVTLFVIGFATLPALGCLISGIGVVMQKPWGRIAGIAFGALSLMNMPFGTLVGLYAIMTLVDKEVAGRFAGEEL